MRLVMIAHSTAGWTPYFARYFISRGDQVLLISFSPKEIPGVEMEFVGILPFDPSKNKHMFISRALRARRIIRRFRPDAVFAPYLSSNGLTAVLAWGGPTVISAVGSDVLEHQARSRWRRWGREQQIRFVCRRSALINTVSKALDDELLRLGVPASKLLRIPFGCDIRRFNPAPDMPRPAATRFICTRAHHSIYDNRTIIEALGHLRASGRQFHCTMTSDGPLLDGHKAQARDAGLGKCVTFTGRLEHDQLPELLRQSDIYLSASLADGTSVSLLEAMSTGLLPVVSQIPANEPWVQHGRTGLLFPPGRADMLAEMLAQAMDNPDLRANAFPVNQQRIHEEGDSTRNMARLAGAIENVVAAHRHD